MEEAVPPTISRRWSRAGTGVPSKDAGKAKKYKLLNMEMILGRAWSAGRSRAFGRHGRRVRVRACRSNRPMVLFMFFGRPARQTSRTKPLAE